MKTQLVRVFRNTINTAPPRLEGQEIDHYAVLYRSAPRLRGVIQHLIGRLSPAITDCLLDRNQLGDFHIHPRSASYAPIHGLEQWQRSPHFDFSL